MYKFRLDFLQEEFEGSETDKSHVQIPPGFLQEEFEGSETDKSHVVVHYGITTFAEQVEDGAKGFRARQG